MNINIRLKAFALLICILSVPAQATFLSTIKEYGYNLTKALAINVIATNCIAGISCTWVRFSRTYGLDEESINEDARSVGSAAQKRFPIRLIHQAPIAPETVPQVIRDRIERLQAQDYTWPTCKPILLAGLAGSGKTQLGYYLARNSNCPFLYESAAGLIGNKKNSGTEGICALFKRARRRPFFESLSLKLKNIVNCIRRRQKTVRKPTVILLDEIDALAEPVNVEQLIEGDKNLEHERHNAFERLLWEIARNPHTVGKPAGMLFNDGILPENNILAQIIRQFPERAEHIPHYACPPADFFEKYLATLVRTEFNLINSINQRLTAEQMKEFLPEESILPSFHILFDNNLGQHKDNLYPQRRNIIQKARQWISRFSLRLVYWIMAKDDTDALVIATTNKDVHQLDPRLRDIFHVVQMRPFNTDQREQILNFHAQGKKLAPVIVLKEIARNTDGFSGDELGSLINNAAIEAAAADRAEITAEDIAQSIARLRERKDNDLVRKLALDEIHEAPQCNQQPQFVVHNDQELLAQLREINFE